MKILAPYYYNDFECIGDKCISNCCGGWDIIVDPISFKKYNEVSGEFGEKLRNSIESKETKANKDTKFIILNGEKKCPLLDENNLCEVYTHLGEEFLCFTCASYPRISLTIGDVTEASLTLSCPEVARILLTIKEPIDFIFSEEESIPSKETKDIDYELYNYLLKVRTLSTKIIQDRSIPLWKRLVLLVSMHNKIQKVLCSNQQEIILKQYYKNEYIINFAKELDIIENNYNQKFTILYNSIMQIKSGSFLEYTQLILKYINTNNIDESIGLYSSLESEFELYYKENLYEYENFIVYYLFRYYMTTLKDKELYKRIVMTCIGYAIIKLVDIYKWYDNGKHLSMEDQCMIFSRFSTNYEHSGIYYEQIYSMLEKNGLNTLGFMVLLVRDAL